MLPFFSTLISSILINTLILFTTKFHGHLSNDNDLNSIQKYHYAPIPRIGGLAIFCSFAATILLSHLLELSETYDSGVLLSGALVFLVGFLEDLTKRVSPLIRINVFIISALIAIYVTGTLPIIKYADFGPLERLIVYHPFIGLILALYCVVGLTNAYNIIDGYNGLSSTTAIINILGLIILALIMHDIIVARIAVCFIAAILGFWLFNYPWGKIFLGDGGAYHIGFVIAVLSIYLVHNHHPFISPYSVLLINIYPITEIGFSIYRRKLIQKTKSMYPDNLHLHQLIYHRCTPKGCRNRNACILPLMLVFIVPQVVLAILFYKDSLACILSIVAFIIFYYVSYFRIVKFKTFRFLKIFSFYP